MFKAIGFIIFLGICLSSSSAQGNELIVGGLVKATQLTGVVTDLDGEPLENVLVTSFDCGPGEFLGAHDFKPIEKVASDDSGRFYLKWPKSHMVCLQFQAFGMKLLQIQVKKSLSGEELHPKLTPST